MSATLAGRNALVLGVERPAGRRIAVALAEAGANVAVVTVSEDTQAEFAANSTANELWAIGVKGIALTSDGHETAVREVIADATVELGPISILIWLAEPLPSEALSGLRSDPAIVVILPDEAKSIEGAIAAPAAQFTSDLAAAGLRANAIVTSVQGAAIFAKEKLRPLEPPRPMDVGEAAIYLVSDESAAIESSFMYGRLD